VSNAAAPTYADPVHTSYASSHDCGPLGALERDVSLCRTTPARAIYLSSQARTVPEIPRTRTPTGFVVDLAHARDRRSRVVDVSVTGPDDRFSLAAVVGKGQQREVGVGAAGVAEEIACSVPHQALNPRRPRSASGHVSILTAKYRQRAGGVWGGVSRLLTESAWFRARRPHPGHRAVRRRSRPPDRGRARRRSPRILVCERLDQRADGRRIVHFRTVERRVGVRLEKATSPKTIRRAPVAAISRIASRFRRPRGGGARSSR